MTSSDRVTWVGHATTVVELDDVRLITDPLLRRRIGVLRWHGPPPASSITTDLDALLISHLHHDHADVPSLRKIDRDVQAFGPAGAGEFLEGLGFRAVSELSPGDSNAIGSITLTAVEADHPNKGRFERGGEAIGFLLSGSRRIYFAGDTDLFDGMNGLGSDLDLALLPIWGWGPNIGVGHLDPERAARAAALLSPRMVVPIHWGTLYPLGLARLRPGPLHSPPEEFSAAMQVLAPQVEARVLAPGDALSLS
jgi:L-ascorbate metabolism protein UlaG (beta-lactamase superfamily)